MNNPEPEQKQTWECTVCYGDGTKLPEGQPAQVTGRIETACKHNICATCYTRIIMEKGKEALCPVCRDKYWKQESEAPEEAGLPLIDILRILQIEPPRIYPQINIRNILFDFE